MLLVKPLDKTSIFSVQARMLVTDHDLLDVILVPFLEACEEKKNGMFWFYKSCIKLWEILFSICSFQFFCNFYHFNVTGNGRQKWILWWAVHHSAEDNCSCKQHCMYWILLLLQLMVCCPWVKQTGLLHSNGPVSCSMISS